MVVGGADMCGAVQCYGCCGWRGYVWCNIPPASEHSDAVGAGEHLEIGTLTIIKMKTHGSQGLVDQNEREKAKVPHPQNHIF